MSLLVTPLVLLATTALLAWGVAAWVLRRAEALRLVQVPNHRSSHDHPTPNGGGLGIVVAGSLGGLVTVETILAPEAPAACVDPDQLELAILNQIDRFNLVIDVIDRVPGLAVRAAHLKEDMKNAIIDNVTYARTQGTDRPEIADWVWPY